MTRRFVEDNWKNANDTSTDLIEEFNRGTESPQWDGSMKETCKMELNNTRKHLSRSRTECVCEAVETYDCPVADIRAEGGQLRLTFHAPDVDRVRAIVTRLKELYDGVSLRSMRRNGDVDPVDSISSTEVNSPTGSGGARTAVEMGYFEYPKGANAGDVADELDISVSTFAEHLAAAQTKLLDSIVAE